MHGFEYFVPTEIVFGAGSTEKLPEPAEKTRTFARAGRLRRLEREEKWIA